MNDALRKLATKKFLGHDSVVGVGTTSGGLVFLLERDSTAAKRKIKAWAKQNGVKPEFKVTGEIVAL